MKGRAAVTPMERLVERLSRLPGLGRRSAARVAFYLLKQPAEEAQQLAQAILDLKLSTRHCSICYNLTESDPCPICLDPRRDHGTVLVVEQPGDVATIEATGLFRGVYHVLMGQLSPLDGVGPGELNIESLIARIHAAPPPGTPGTPGSLAPGNDPRSSVGNSIRGGSVECRIGGSCAEFSNESEDSGAAEVSDYSDEGTVDMDAECSGDSGGVGDVSDAGSGRGGVGRGGVMRRVVREVVLGTNPTLEGDGTSLYLAGRVAKLGVKVSRLARGLPTGAHLDTVSKAVLSDAIHGRQAVK